MAVILYTLVEAIQVIQEKYGRTIEMIEYEDGTCRAFNVRFSGDKRKTYIWLD